MQLERCMRGCLVLGNMEVQGAWWLGARGTCKASWW